MILFDKSLQVQTSLLPGCGNGLFTKVFIAKGSIITEYKGKVTTWNDADHDDGKNLYIYYLTRNHVIDANGKKDDFAHFANDAKGITKVAGLNNNAHYVTKGKRVFIEATKNIHPGDEIFVGYGKEYWDTIKKNKIM